MLKIMKGLSLKERACLIRAYPHLRKHGQSGALNTRVITASDANHLDISDLANVLDPEGKAIELSLGSLDSVLGSNLILNISRLMPDLEEITLTRSKLPSYLCSCQCHSSSHSSGFYCSASVFWNQLTRVRVLKIEDRSEGRGGGEGGGGGGGAS